MQLKQKSINSEHRHIFSMIGFGLTIFAISSYLLYFGLNFIIHWIAPNFQKTNLCYFITSSLPMYLICIPICYFFLKKIPSNPPNKVKISVKQWFLFIPMILGLSSIGSILSGIIVSVINATFGITLKNDVSELILNINPIYTLIFAVILAPIFEELLFRKIIIDKTLPYGESISIILSGLLFGLFHGNFFQFFYATIVGMFFALIYIKTGKIQYTILLHTVLNFIGSIVPIFLLRNFDAQTSNAILNGEISNITLTPNLVMLIISLLIYGVLMFIIDIIGIILFIIYIKKTKLETPEIVLPKRILFSVTFLNFGMLLFILICINKFILNML